MKRWPYVRMIVPFSGHPSNISIFPAWITICPKWNSLTYTMDFHDWFLQWKSITCGWTPHLDNYLSLLDNHLSYYLFLQDNHLSLLNNHLSHMEFPNALYGYPSRTTILPLILYTHPQCYKNKFSTLFAYRGWIKIWIVSAITEIFTLIRAQTMTRSAWIKWIIDYYMGKVHHRSKNIHHSGTSPQTYNLNIKTIYWYPFPL